MKGLVILILLVSLFPHKERNAYIISGSVQQQDSSSWIQEFRNFRAAVYEQDKNKVKLFIDFPIMNENNEIWYLVYGENEKALKLLSDKPKPFTEKDFDKYFDKIFTKHFVKTILKLKTEELFKKGETETIELNDGKATSYKMYAIYDKANKTLSLNLASNTVQKDTSGEILDGGEFNVIYYFNIPQTGKIKFYQVRIAG